MDNKLHTLLGRYSKHLRKVWELARYSKHIRKVMKYNFKKYNWGFVFNDNKRTIVTTRYANFG